ncbi:MAG: radical SAM protein [Treponemataceae bacterium]|nr:radical SAM protein [Treponemataceae bacterium]
MRVEIIQPPLVQLNTPYPSGAYLSAFFKEIKKEDFSCIESVKWYDFSEKIFNSLFSKKGLEKLFSLSEKKALDLAEEAEKKGDSETAWNLRRYVSQSDMWIKWIDTVVCILCGKDRELCHEFVRSAYVPRGRRMETFLESLDHEVSIDDAQLLASFALADLADYINYAFDGNFSLIRYAEAVSTGNNTFSQIEETIDAPFLKAFYAPLLDDFLLQLEKSEPLPFSAESSYLSGKKYMFCISVPFGGTFSAALYTCRRIKEKFGREALVCIGGGYINTALREIHDEGIFDYVDYISYDKGYAFYISLLNNSLKKTVENNPETRSLLVGSGLCYQDKTWVVLNPDDNAKQREEILTRSISPDFSDIDFSLYPKVSDDTNPMHRIWTDGSWIKAFLAYGCYWHRCAFCDTMLDYVCKYSPVSLSSLYDGIYKEAEQAGVYGIHFVDEAAPPALLEQFAIVNSKNKKRSLSFWGNIRFEKAFTRDAADILAYGGMIGVSGGIEIASGEGLSDVNKGIDIESLVSACAAFKEAGILVHAYMIYGFYNETPQMLIDSVETLRQLFKAGLIDSAFWHKFTLTKYSTVYNDWKKGLCKDIKPIFPKGDPFAVYELHFEGEEKSEKYGPPLYTALDSWMHGNGLNKPVQKWFPFAMPKPSVRSDFIDKAIEKYEHRRNKAFNEKYPSDENFSKYLWIGNKPILVERGKKAFLEWTYMGELFSAEIPPAYLEKSGSGGQEELYSITGCLENPEKYPIIPEWLFRATRGKGLAKTR